MILEHINLTDEIYQKEYEVYPETVVLRFNKTVVEITHEQFEKLKEDIIEQELEGEITAIKPSSTKPPERETLLKELTKTIDKITDLTNRYDSNYHKLMRSKKYHTFKEDLEVKNRLLPISRARNYLMNYKEKLEAQLKYGELQ